MTTTSRRRAILQAAWQVFLAVAVVTLLVVSLYQGAQTREANGRSERLEQRIDRYRSTNEQLSESITGLTEQLARRSPVTQFFVCWAGRMGDFGGAIAWLILHRDASPAQLDALGVIGQRLAAAGRLRSDGGCLDPAVTVTVEPPITFPTN